MSWLDLLLKQTEEYESPERYFWWSGLAAISAVAGKNVWLQRGKAYRLYTNIYVILVSSRPALRKGFPVSLCKTVLQKLDRIRIISGCNSIQGVIRELSEAKSNFKSGAVVSEAQGILIAPELDVFLIDDTKALSTLMDLYNASEHEGLWVKNLKSGTTELKNPCLTLLGASNETLFNKVVKRQDIEGGFISRTFVVYEDKIKRPNPLTDDPEVDVDYDELVKRLDKVSQLNGPFQWSAAAKIYYRSWYAELSGREIIDSTGSVDRLTDQVLRVAMLISLSKRDELILNAEDIQEAVEKSLICVNSVKRITTPAVMPTNGDRPDVRRLIEKYLMEAPTYMLTRPKLKARLHAKGVYSSAMDLHLKEMKSDGWMVAVQKEGEWIYQITDEGYRNLAGEFLKKVD